MDAAQQRVRARGAPATRTCAFIAGLTALGLTAAVEARGAAVCNEALTLPDPTLVVNCMYQSHDGDFWFGTDRGLLRFDGLRFETFRAPAPLPSDSVTALVDDGTSTLWVATTGGVVRRDSLTAWHPPDPGLPASPVLGLYVDGGNHVWARTAEAVARFESGAWYEYSSLGLANTQVLAFALDNVGLPLVGTDHGAARFDGAAWNPIPFPDDPVPPAVQELLQDRLGVIWMNVDNRRLQRFDPATGISEGMSDAEPEIHVFRARDGVLWVSDQYGIERKDGPFVRRFEVNPLGSGVTRIQAEDANGNIWGESKKNVFRADALNAESYDLELFVPIAYPCGFTYRDRNGALWRMLNGHGHRFAGPGDVWTVPYIDMNDRHDVRLGEDHHGRMWVISDQGATPLDQEPPTADSLDGQSVTAMALERLRRTWFGTTNGAWLYEGFVWQHFTHVNTGGGLPSDKIRSVVVGPDDHVWFTTDAGVGEASEGQWTPHSMASTQGGLPGDNVFGSAVAPDGTIWFATTHGLAGYRDGTWNPVSYPGPDDSLIVDDLAVDLRGAVWMVVRGREAEGTLRYDGTGWSAVPGRHGPLCTDSRGLMWADLDVFDGTWWGTIRPGQGLDVEPIFTFADHLDRLYFVTPGMGTLNDSIYTIALYEPDRVAPKATLEVPAVYGSRQVTIGLGVFGDPIDGEFCVSLDQGPGEGSAWDRSTSRIFQNVPDGPHVVRVLARDKALNVSPTVVTRRFEVDATPPSPALEAPVSGSVGSGLIVISGTAADARFDHYRVDVRAAGSADWDSIGGAAVQVTAGRLAEWDTRAGGYADGSYEIRLTVRDTLGLSGSSTTIMRLDNVAPFDSVTSPVSIAPSRGGDVFSLDGLAHLYVQPNAFDLQATVTVVRVQVPCGNAPAEVAYRLEWSQPLRKAAVVEIADPEHRAGAASALWRCSESGWVPIGGTADRVRGVVTAAVQDTGAYALREGGIPNSGQPGPRDLRLSPRVFSPMGGVGARQISIAFSLGRSVSVTVDIYDRTGRLVRRVLRDETLSAGQNVVRWDGRDRDGDVVDDGLYIVTVEADGEKMAKPFAVVR